MPASEAALKDGRMASESKATTRITSTFCEIRLSMSAACFSAEPDASALMYFRPALSSAALIASIRCSDELFMFLRDCSSASHSC